MFHDSRWPAPGNTSKVTREGLSSFSLRLVEKVLPWNEKTPMLRTLQRTPAAFPRASSNC